MRIEYFGPATLYLGDCREVISSLPNAVAVISDPPYGTQELAGGYGRRQIWAKDGDYRTSRVIANDRDLSVLAESLPLMAEKVPVGWMFVFYGARKSIELLELSRGLEWFGDVIWDKGAPGLGFHIRYAHESIAVFRRGEPPRPKDALLSVIRVPITREANPEHHPHEKPVALMKPIVKWACPVNGTVLDPFMGSGSTGLAAVSQGRKFIGIECDVTWFDISCRRIEEELAAQDNGATMWEGLGLLV